MNNLSIHTFAFALIVLQYESKVFALFYNIVEMFYMTIIIGFKDNKKKKKLLF